MGKLQELLSERPTVDVFVIQISIEIRWMGKIYQDKG